MPTPFQVLLAQLLKAEQNPGRIVDLVMMGTAELEQRGIMLKGTVEVLQASVECTCGECPKLVQQ